MLREGLPKNEVKKFVKRNEVKLEKMMNETIYIDRNGREIYF